MKLEVIGTLPRHPQQTRKRVPGAEYPFGRYLAQRPRIRHRDFDRQRAGCEESH